MWQWISTRDWQFINTFADWFSALGTLVAVIVALYLASRDRRIHLKVNAGIRLLVGETRSVHNNDRYMNISITNIGRRTARVTGILFKPVPFKKEWVMINLPRNAVSSSCPITLQDSEVANYLMLLDEFKAVNADKTFYVGHFPRLAARCTKVIALTSTGKACSSKIERGLGDWFLSANLYRKPEKTASAKGGPRKTS